MTTDPNEKRLACLVGVSLLLHLACFVLLQRLPVERPREEPAPIMVELEELPQPTPEQRPAERPVQRHDTVRRRVPREVAPRGDSLLDRKSLPAAPVRPLPGSAPSVRTREAPLVPSRDQSSTGRPEVGSWHRPAPRTPDLAQLYPSSANLARLEESYRKKFGAEVEEGATRFLNTDDILFGSFLRRFENAIYGVWRYPDDASRLGVEGVTPVRITFNRRGEIIGRELLQSSGSRLLDSEVLRALDQVGPVGSFPRGYDKDTFNLIAFFHYEIVQGARRTMR